MRPQCAHTQGPGFQSCRDAECAVRPQQLDGVDIAGSTSVPAGGEGGGPAGAPRLTTEASWGASGSPSSCSPPLSKHTRTQHAHDTHSPSVYLYPWVDVPAFALWPQHLRHNPTHRTPIYHDPTDHTPRHRSTNGCVCVWGGGITMEGVTHLVTCQGYKRLTSSCICHKGPAKTKWPTLPDLNY